MDDQLSHIVDDDGEALQPWTTRTPPSTDNISLAEFVVWIALGHQADAEPPDLAELTAIWEALHEPIPLDDGNQEDEGGQEAGASASAADIGQDSAAPAAQ